MVVAYALPEKGVRNIVVTASTRKYALSLSGSSRAGTLEGNIQIEDSPSSTTQPNAV